MLLYAFVISFNFFIFLNVYIVFIEFLLIVLITFSYL